jgi:putative methyltransferase (TIGR04325 family)
MSERDAFIASTFWQGTRPLRAVADLLPIPIRRLMRRAVKVSWWALSLQLPRRLRQRRAGAMPPSGAHPNLAKPDLDEPRAAQSSEASPQAGTAEGEEDPSPEWEYVPEGWHRQTTDPAIKGWNVEDIPKIFMSNWDAFTRTVQGTEPLGVTPEVPGVRDNYTVHNWTVSFGYALALAARGKKSLSLLDWGGSVGYYYLISEALLPGVAIEYHVKDVPKLCACGESLLPNVRFHLDDTCLRRTYNLVLASGSLQFAEDWKSTLRRLALAAEDYLYVTRLPIVNTANSFVVVQRPYWAGYNTEFLGWYFNRDEFLNCVADAGMALMREFLVQEKTRTLNAPEDCDYRGFLFKSVRGPAKSG